MEELNIKNNELDYGVTLYEKSNAKSILDAPTGKVGAKGWAQRIYMLILCVCLFGWFLYSLITKATQPDIGFGKAVLNHLVAFFLLLMAELILILTAFNGWGKFARMVLRHKALTRQHGMEGVRTRQLEEELREADANKSKENAVRIYREYVVVVKLGETTVISKNELQRVKCEKYPGGYKLTFCRYEGEEVVPNILLPLSDLPLVKQHFDNFEYTNKSREKGYLKKKLPMLAFASIPLLIGTAILILRGLLLHGMPIIFGLVFVSFGVIFMTGQFSEIAVINYGVMTILGGMLLIGLPLGIALTIVDLVKSISFTTVLTTFTPVHAVLSVFLGLGPMMIILGIAGIVDCAKL